MIQSLLAEYSNSFESEFHDFLAGGGDDSLVLFGAGHQGQLTLTELRALGLGGNVRCFVDNNAGLWGTCVMGVEVRSPSTLDEGAGTARVLVTVGESTPVLHQLDIMGLGSSSRVCDVSALRNGLYSRAVIEKHAQELQSLYDALADERSRMVLVHLIRHRLGGDRRDLVRICDDDQYFDDEVIRLGADEVFIDGGAYDGDTIAAFTRHCPGGMFRAVFAFEPDSRNFARLAAFADAHPLNERIHVIEAALHRETCSMVFDEGPEMSSHLSAGGNCVVQAVTLDEALAGESATFLKFDLEGAEREALMGAAETIRRGGPKLAVAAYHRPDDLWVLWRLIGDLRQGYKFYLRHYSHFTFESILYAIPGEVRVD